MKALRCNNCKKFASKDQLEFAHGRVLVVRIVVRRRERAGRQRDAHTRVPQAVRAARRRLILIGARRTVSPLVAYIRQCGFAGPYV